MRRGEKGEAYQGLGGEGITVQEEIGRRLRRRRSGSGKDRAAVREEERGEVREMPGVWSTLYRAEEEEEGARKAVAGARRPAINGGGGSSGSGGACGGGERMWEAQVSEKGSHRGSRVCSYRARRGGGASTEVMAINGHGGGQRLQSIQEGET
jgi:hypothetical protein